MAQMDTNNASGLQNVRKQRTLWHVRAATMLGIAVIPSAAHIGIWAGVLAVVCRMLQGLVRQARMVGGRLASG